MEPKNVGHLLTTLRLTINLELATCVLGHCGTQDVRNTGISVLQFARGFVPYIGNKVRYMFIYW